MDLKTILEEAKFYMMNHRYEKAQELLKKGLALYPDDEDLLFTLAMLYEIMSDNSKAHEIYTKILNLYPDTPRRKKIEDRLRRLET